MAPAQRRRRARTPWARRKRVLRGPSLPYRPPGGPDDRVLTSARAAGIPLEGVPRPAPARRPPILLPNPSTHLTDYLRPQIPHHSARNPLLPPPKHPRSAAMQPNELLLIARVSSKAVRAAPRARDGGRAAGGRGATAARRAHWRVHLRTEPPPPRAPRSAVLRPGLVADVDPPGRGLRRPQGRERRWAAGGGAAAHAQQSRRARGGRPRARPPPAARRRPAPPRGAAAPRPPQWRGPAAGAGPRRAGPGRGAPRAQR
jgi:hypothetical protein